MIKSTRKRNKLFKGAVLGAAVLMCASFVPFNALKFPTVSAEAVTSGQPIITLSGAPADSVTKGQSYIIKAAKFSKKGTEGELIIGNDSDSNKATLGVDKSTVEVFYKGTSTAEKVTTNISEGNYGSFTPTRVGRYTVVYTVVLSDKTQYSYEYEFKCETSNAHFEFSAFDTQIIPTVYDIDYLKTKPNGATVEYKNIELPLPSVYDEFDVLRVGKKDDEELVGNYYAVDSATEAEYIVITVEGPGEDVTVQSGEGNSFYINGENLTEGQYTVTYTYYQNKQYIASTEKEFKVEKSYYVKSDGKPGYTLDFTWETSVPTSAVVGVKTLLPVPKGWTSESDDPAKEEVAVNYSIKAKLSKNGQEVEVNDIVKEDNNYYFVPSEKGNYTISYEVKDFYGNTVKATKTQFQIRDVKDSRPPEVFAYDASSYEEGQDYVSAENRLVSKTSNKNIVIYAIGAKDNNKNANLTIKRVIRNSGSAVLLEITDYNDKNLIFNYTNASEFLATNFAIRRDLEKAKVLVAGDERDYTTKENDIKTWLTSHGYLFVTNEEDNKDQDGYAYFDTKIEWNAEKYRIVYSAKDEDNTTPAEKIYELEVKQGTYEDTTAPVLKAVTGLQNAYLPTDKITFTPSTASDSEGDDRIEVVTAYRYLDSDKGVIAVKDGNEDVEYAYVKAGKTASAEKNGWIKFDALKDGETQYTINLKDRSAETSSAAYVELFIYSYDDFGNVGVYNKVMGIAQIVKDLVAPELIDVTNGSAASVNHGAPVTLPTLTYKDDNPEFMSARVYVNHITRGTEGENDGKVVGTETMTCYNMNSYPDVYNKLYIVEAGEFSADFEGEYQVAIVASDSANNSTITYFTYNAGPFATYESPSIENISTETIPLELGKSYNFPSPTIAMSTSSSYSYVGLDSDGKTSTYYTIKSLDAANASFNAGLYFFKSLKEGRFAFQYTVYLIRYNNKNITTAKPESADGYFVENGQLKFHSNTKSEDYLVSVDTKTGKLMASKDGVVASDVTLENGEDKDVYLIVLPSGIQTIVVTDTVAPVVSSDLLKGIKGSYKVQEGGVKIPLPEISAEEESEGFLDVEDSYVQVVKETPNKTSTVLSTNTYTVSIKDWATGSGNLKYEDNQLVLNLDEEGTYYLTYHIEDTYGNAAPDVKKTIRYGDTNPPSLNLTKSVANGLLRNQSGVRKANEFSLNDELILDISKLDISDIETTDRDTLLKTLKITVYNNDTDTKLENLANAEEGNYRYKLSTAAEYKITVSIQDEAGYITERSTFVNVKTSTTNAQNTHQVVGTVLIIVAVIILVGVVAYFIYSKVKLDKEEKRRRK